MTVARTSSPERVAESAEQLTARAVATPLLIGAKGSALELVLNSLYFESDRPESIRVAEAERVADSGLARAVPLYVRFRSRKRPIVGTSFDYFEVRGLRVAAGRNLATLGECVVGARVARESGIEPGDSVLSSPESVFDIAGVYPLKMHVVGVLAAAGTPDDDAIFVDLKTAWIIEGLGHGHRDLDEPGAASDVLERDGRRITANAAVRQHAEVTDKNLESFHFHGDQADYPITAILAVPHDAKSAALLRGRYQSKDELLQIVRPAAVVDQLLATVFTVQSYVVVAMVFVGSSTLLTSVLVFLLSLRLRRREIETMVKIGAGKGSIRTVLALEVAFVVAASVALAGGLTLLSARYGSELMRSLLMS